MKKSVWIAGVTAAAAAGLILMAPMPTRAEEMIPEGVFVGDESLAGMTGEEAEKKISEYVEGKLGQNITFVVDGSEVYTSAEELGLSWSNQDTVNETLKDTEIKGNLVRRYMKKKDLQLNPVKIELEMALDQEKVSAFVDDKCADIMTQAKDAAITKTDGKFVITPSEKGKTVDIESTKMALNEALNLDSDGNITVTAVITEQEPKITTEQLSEIKDVLGTFSTNFSSSGASRATNLRVGAGKINGHVLMPGEVLSGYECMQPITTANGYKTAIAYENGRSVDSVGGGVCQISTTLYNAALMAEMEIVQRQNHSMTVAYVKPSMDAAIAGTYKDLKFKNPYDSPIYVEGDASGKTLTFTIYGKETRPANRTIEFESETLQRMDAGAPIEQVDPSLAPGTRIKVESGHTGLRSRLYKCVYVDGKLEERTLLHNDTYNPSKAIYRVGPAAPAIAPPLPAETPTETQPPVTDPVETQPAETQPQGPGYVDGPGAFTPTEAPASGPGAPAPTEAAPVSAPSETPAPAPALPEAPAPPGPAAPEIPAA